MGSDKLEVIPEQEVYLPLEAEGHLLELLGNLVGKFVYADTPYAVLSGCSLLEANSETIRFGAPCIIFHDYKIYLVEEPVVLSLPFDVFPGEYVYVCISFPDHGCDSTPQFQVTKLETDCSTIFYGFKVNDKKELKVIKVPPTGKFISFDGNITELVYLTNGSTNTFPYDPITTVLKVYLNGLLLMPNEDYIINKQNQTVTIKRALRQNEVVTIRGLL